MVECNMNTFKSVLYSRLRVILTFLIGMLQLLEMTLFTVLFQEQSPGDSKDFAILRFHAGPPYEV